ncbi:MULTISPECIES: helix-turn-helix domain-containing protein [unclassified Clostridium]|uniref:helix-turn-helix domain-containing protein n=1 Tax=unclassified Clostridium TaxID=2614128 RepID=UPI000297710A|nr:MULTISPECIES: helix-turn-helix domain-containing protein [unclassified Clostridium]EKQ54357.1 MAG: DNA-binding protein, excisionase family [Clostridium sp. Maddingley MBC34-26]
MENEILTLEEACEFLHVSDRTMIKLLREDHLPARKIGREWRFSRKALIDWIGSGDSVSYTNQDETYAVYQDKEGNYKDIINDICNEASKLKENNDIKSLIKDLNFNINIPDDVKLSISYKQKRDIEKLEFKIFWSLRDEVKITTKKQTNKYY